MASSFMGLYVQRDGLNLAQKAQDVTGNNLTNSKTAGYTRQHLDLVSVKIATGTLGYKNQIFLAGAGVDGLGVGQTRDKILDTRYRGYSSSSSNLAVKSNVLSKIEDAIDDIEIDTIDKGKEENKTGLANILENFKSAWQAFSSSGTDQVDLANIARSSAQQVVEVFHDFSARIEQVSDDLISDTMASVNRVNEILKECAGINRSLQAGYINMNNFYDNGYGYQADVTYGPLEIKDKMNMLLDELSTYVDMSSTIEEDGTYTISVSGVEVVNHFDYSKLLYKQDVNYHIPNPEYTLKNGSYYDSKGNEVTDPAVLGNLERKKEQTDLGEPIYTYEKPDPNGGDPEIIKYVLRDGKYYNKNTDRELTEPTIIAQLQDPKDVSDENGNPVFIDPTVLDDTALVNYDERKIPPTKLTFQFSAMKPESKWYSSKVQFEKGNVFPAAAEEYRAAMYDALSKGEFENAYNIERKFTNDYTDFSGLPADYVPVFGKVNATNAKDKITDITQNVKQGSLKGDLDMYNGAGPYASSNPTLGENTYKGVEYYRQTFNEFAKTITNAFNEIYTNNGIVDDPNTTDVDESFKIFEFYLDDNGNEILSADQIKVAKLFEDNPIRAVHPEYTDSGALRDESNFDQISNKWINRLTSVFEAEHTYGKETGAYTFEDFVAHYGNTLGAQLESTNHAKDAEYILLDGVEEARIDVMGVSTDEEGVNMMTNQKWYNAMARMMTALDQLLDKLINNTGIVGL